ncbi:response regulator transcription factor [Shumkonia mesophila]|uniref:response regulator transcription factor n=1 Tax=Shumkonia mesophila TaxID=2838854 RepID=UPI002934328F|nr:response regulator transcription factor [Shumkonia mesophila]
MTVTGSRILVVDDEPQILKFLEISLTAYGYEVEQAASGEEALQVAAIKQPDLVILDLGLPGISGHDVIARIREWSQVPIIVLSVREAESEKIRALDLGATDYVTKPFGIGELMARIRAILRDQSSGQHEDKAVIEVGDLHIDLALRRITVGEREVKLTKREFDVLWYLARHADRIVTHQQLLREVWGPAQEHETHYLRVYIRHLRQKLGDDSSHPRYIGNEPGVGYRLLVPPDPA